MLSHDAKKASSYRVGYPADGNGRQEKQPDRLPPQGVSMSRCQRLQTVGLCLALGLLLSACDPKPTATGAASSSGASPSGVKPADSGDKVDPTSAHKGPSEGGAAVGGMSGQGGASSGGTPAPSGGDGTAPK
jgi:hypothetical protein